MLVGIEVGVTVGNGGGVEVGTRVGIGDVSAAFASTAFDADTGDGILYSTIFAPRTSFEVFLEICASDLYTETIHEAE